MFEQVEVNSERWFDLKPLKNEEWRDIKGFEKLYQISNYGRVKSLERTTKQFNRFKICNRYVPERILKCCYDKDKYLVVTLNKNKKGYWKRVHQLMGYTFLNNNGDFIINHKDLNKQNPRIDNLELCTDYENKQHAKNNGAVRKGRKLILYNDFEKKEYENVKDYAKKENISYAMANYYIYKKKKWKNYKFYFVNDNN